MRFRVEITKNKLTYWPNNKDESLLKNLLSWNFMIFIIIKNKLIIKLKLFQTLRV